MLDFGNLIEELKVRKGMTNTDVSLYLDVSKSLLIKYISGESYPKYEKSVPMLEKMDTELKIDYGSGVEDFDYEKFKKFISDNINEYGLLRMQLRTGMSTATLNRTRKKADVNLNLRIISCMADGMKIKLFFEKHYEMQEEEKSEEAAI